MPDSQSSKPETYRGVLSGGCLLRRLHSAASTWPLGQSGGTDVGFDICRPHASSEAALWMLNEYFRRGQSAQIHTIIENPVTLKLSAFGLRIVYQMSLQKRVEGTGSEHKTSFMSAKPVSSSCRPLGFAFARGTPHSMPPTLRPSEKMRTVHGSRLRPRRHHT